MTDKTPTRTYASAEIAKKLKRALKQKRKIRAYHVNAYGQQLGLKINFIPTNGQRNFIWTDNDFERLLSIYDK